MTCYLLGSVAEPSEIEEEQQRTTRDGVLYVDVYASSSSPTVGTKARTDASRVSFNDTLAIRNAPFGTRHSGRASRSDATMNPRGDAWEEAPIGEASFAD